MFWKDRDNIQISSSEPAQYSTNYDPKIGRDCPFKEVNN